MGVGTTRQERFSADFLMGGGAAVIAKSAAAPIERVKLLLQNQGEMLKRGHLKRPYMGVADGFSRVFREEGVLSFWRGNQANVIRYFPTQMLVIPRIVPSSPTSKKRIKEKLSWMEYNSSNSIRRKSHWRMGSEKEIIKKMLLGSGYFKSLLGCSKEKDGYLKWFAGNVASGSAAGATTSLFLYHLDYARTRLATDARECPITGQRQFKGLLDVYRKTLSTDGIPGLYRGFGISIMGITLYRGMYFGIYDSMKPIVLVGPLEGNFFASFLLGWSITTVSGVCAYPFDTLRRRMMLTSGQPLKYRSTMHAVREIIRLEGFAALFRGVTANILVGMAGAGVLAGYDQLHRIAYRHGYGFEPLQKV